LTIDTGVRAQVGKAVLGVGILLQTMAKSFKPSQVYRKKLGRPEPEHQERSRDSYSLDASQYKSIASQRLPAGSREIVQTRPGARVRILLPPTVHLFEEEANLTQEPFTKSSAYRQERLDGQKIPPGETWTKIKRRLVNPAALRAYGEQFLEIPDYVIVKRMLEESEIQEYANMTWLISESEATSPADEIDRSVLGKHYPSDLTFLVGDFLAKTATKEIEILCGSSALLIAFLRTTGLL
jgi:hypothetical protein